MDIAYGSFSRMPLGWGPFRIVEWVAGNHLTLERNPHYFRLGYPKLDRVIIRFMTGGSEPLRQAMLRGEVQVVGSMASSFPRDQLQTIANDAAMRLLTTDSMSWEHIDFNLQPTGGRTAFFADKNVRQAVSYALDRQRMIDMLYGGYGTVPDEYIPSAHWAYTSTVHTYPYSLTLAADMLTAAGWVDSNADGIREKDGVPFTFTHSTTDRPIARPSAASCRKTWPALASR